MQATPIPGTPVFGHAGSIIGDTIVYVDGAYRNPSGSNPKYLASSECWMGRIPKKGDFTKIAWTRLPPHPGSARYRIAAGAGLLGRKDARIYFSGGTSNPYDYNGIGYNGQPSEPSSSIFAFDFYSENWETLRPDRPPSIVDASIFDRPIMDERSLVFTDDGLMTIGGMEKGQQPTAKVTVVKLARGQ
jgi:hypothetical protein